MPMRRWRWRWCWCWSCLRLDRTDIDATIHHPHKTRATLIHSQRWITRVDCRAIRFRQMGESGTAVILQRSEHWIGANPIASGRQITAATVTAQIIAERGYGAEGFNIINVLA